MNHLTWLVPIFLLSIALIVIVVRYLVSATPDNKNKNDNENDNDNEKKIIMIVLSFISSSVVLLYASYLIRPPYRLGVWSLYIVALLVLLITPFGLVVLRLFVGGGSGGGGGSGSGGGSGHLRIYQVLLILSTLVSMLYTFGGAGGMALFGK